MRILIATVKVPFIRGGAELHADNLAAALVAEGHEAEIIAVPFKWYPPERILDHMLACRLLDLTETAGTKVDMVVGLKFPAYYVQHPNKILWILHQHRQAYELWDHPIAGDMIHFPNGLNVRKAIHDADRKLIGEASAIYANSRNVAGRLERYCGISSTPLYHPPPKHECFYSGAIGDYLLYPSRLTPIKRQALVLEALAQTVNPVVVHFAGRADMPDYLEQLREQARKLGVDKRVRWLGGISDDEKFRAFAKCLAVIYPPVDEDYGYVTLEAMLSSKAVITCTDSGGTQEFVIHNQTGLVVEPEPARIAAAMDTLWQDRASSRDMGHAGRDHYASLDISWQHVVKTLTAR